MWLNEPLDDVLSSRGKVAVLRVLSSTTVPLNGREAVEKSRQLLAMLRQKTAVQYLGKPVPGDTIAKTMKQAQRFMEWAADILPSAESLSEGQAGTRG
jgi:hypothetical protein